MNRALLFTLALLATGCAETQGTDDTGPPATEETSTVNGSTQGGQGLTANGELAVEVAVQVLVDGAWIESSRAAVDEAGAYAAEVPAEAERVIVQALDENGEVVAQTLVAATAEAGGSVTAAPMTAETTLEAMVLAELAAAAGTTEGIDALDLRGRIDEAMAREAEAGDVTALADAIAAAQAAEEAAWAGAGLDLTQEVVFQASLDAGAEYDLSLDAGTPMAAATASWQEAQAGVESELGLNEAHQAESEASASASFRAVLSAQADGAFVEAAILQAAELEAMAVAELLVTLEGGAETQAALEDAADQLVADVSDAVAVDEAIQAFAQLEASLIGQGSLQGSVLGIEVGGDAAAEAAASVVVGAAVEGADAYIAAIDGAADADPHVAAQAIVEARSALRGQIEDAAATAGSVQLAASVSMMATASFR